MSWNEFLVSDDFKKYRHEQVKVITQLVDRKLWGKEESDLKGIIELAKEILRLPETLCTGKAEQLREDLIKDYKTLAAELVRAQISVG
jgi:hypothetical protein